MNGDIGAAAPRPCEACGGARLNRHYRLPEFVVLRCDDCGLLRLSLHPGRAGLEAMYGEDYFRGRQRYYFGNAVLRPDLAPDENLRGFEALLDCLEARRGSGRLLDVGCGVGIFLSLARARGWTVQGVEVSPFAAQEARSRLGLPVTTGTLREAAPPEACFDVVTLLDVFEHLADPSAELRELFRVLRPGGTLLLDTPNADALLRRMADRIYRWSGGTIVYPVRKLYHQFHLFYYSEQALRRLLGDAGFRVERVDGRAIPLPKARGNTLEKWIVKGLTAVERRLGGPYELIVTAERPARPERM